MKELQFDGGPAFSHYQAAVIIKKTQAPLFRQGLPA